MKNKSMEYYDWIDVAKGIGIILVVIGHSFRDNMRIESVFCEYIYQIIYAFHMPFFFAISGLTFYQSFTKNNVNKKNLFIKKVKRLVVPAISYAAFIYLCYYIVSLNSQIRDIMNNALYTAVPLKEYVIENICGVNQYAFHLWFLWTLFWINVFMLIYLNYVQISNFSIILIAIIMFFLNQVVSVQINIINYFFNVIPYFCLGMLLAHNNIWYWKTIKTKGRIKILFAIGWMALTLFVSYKIVVQKTENNTFIESFILLGINIIIIISLFLCSMRIEKLHWIRKIGKDSFAIYLLHQPFCCGFMGLLLYEKYKLSIFITCIICVGLSFILPYAIMWLINKNRMLRKIFKFFLNI